MKALRVTAAEVESKVAELASAGLDVVLQEYVPGPPSAHYFVDGYVARDGRTLARLARRRLRMFPLVFGNSTYHATVPFHELADAAAELERLFDSVDYRGIFSAEFKRDERDGTTRLLEVNVRPWWYVEFAALCGVDVCELAYRDALGLPVEEVKEYEVGARCVLPGADARAFLALRRSGELGVRTWLQSWIGASHTVFSVADPLPSVMQLVDLGTRRLSRLGRLERAERG